MPHPLLDPRRLAALNALGVQQAWVPRDALDETELAALMPHVGPVAPAAGRRQPAAVARADAPAARAEPVARPAAGVPATSAQAADAAAAAAPRAEQPTVAAQRVEQVRALAWEPLQAFTEACRACKLGGMRHQAVFGVGHAQARVMVVGEAPGAEEDRVGEPFVGAAGKLLDNMLRACGLQRHGDDPRSTVYVANVIKCRPPGNRNPEPDEIAQCLPILRRQIELVRPRLLLALGRFAAQSLTGSSEPIGRLRQRAWDWQGTPVVVSYHPAYLLRTPQDKAKAWADLCRAQDLLDAL